jgi:thiopeptide-type bacteriocin biosynthesis protein
MIAVRRTFFAGDEWLYYKIYSGPKTLENILVQDIYHVVEKLIAEGVADKFFFIRYSDPDYHLRIRFHLPDVSRINEIIKRMNEALTYYLENRLVTKVIIDTYVRELERYGMNTVDDIEHFFYVDSLFILQYLKECDRKDEWRWLMSVKLIDRLLDKFEMPLPDKVKLFQTMVDNFSVEFNMNKSLKVQLDNKFRISKKLMEASMQSTDIENGAAMDTFFEKNATVIAKILKLHTENQLEVPFESLLGSIIHMHFNRLFRTKQRLQEFVIYYFMHRYYVSLSARLKYSKTSALS